MIVGLGTDIVGIERVRRLLQRYPNFAPRIFTALEISHCESRADAAQSFAARFAAKEALMKAVGTGWDGKINWQDIEVRNDQRGKPELFVHAGCRALLEQLRVTHIHVSLSHEREYAIACVVLEHRET